MADFNPFDDVNGPTSSDSGVEELGLAPWASAAPPTTSGSTWSLGSGSDAFSTVSSSHSQPPLPQSRRELRERAAVGEKRTRGQKQSAPPSAKKPRPSKRVPRGKSAPPPRALAATPSRPASHPSQKSLRKRVTSRLFSLAALLFSGALMLGMSVPAMAINQGGEAVDASAPVQKVDGQTLAAAQLTPEAAPLQRDEFGVTSYAEIMRLKYGNRSYNYNVNWTGPVRWPFPFTVPISSGYGDRQAPCRGCSAYHRGIDLTPGAGQPIYAIADGVVSDYNEGWTYGNHVFIDHVINGQRIRSLYAHMETGSSPLLPGQQVLVGDYVGLVGNTGSSTGPHLHLEVRLDGVTPVDPFTWLNANTTQ